MDYDIEMLKLYFKEKNYTKEKIQQLINNNPFNADYVKWENQTKINDKVLSKIIKKLNLIYSNCKLQEVTNHEKNSIGHYLTSSCEVRVLPMNSGINNLRLNSSKILLMKGFLPNQKLILKKASHYNMPFIVGVCTENIGFYERMKYFYEELRDEIINTNLIEEKYHNHKICILTKNKKH